MDRGLAPKLLCLVNGKVVGKKGPCSYHSEQKGGEGRWGRKGQLLSEMLLAQHS